ncbi:hypothetical protein NC651_005755 [Populus alba x Populus x berolinensis]|nr:hypothetical protein NC651_005755 [Populus alba x Populus x berolinensis]
MRQMLEILNQTKSPQRKAKQKLKKWKDDDKLTKWNFNQWTIVKKLKLTTTKEASRERRLGQLMQGNA